MGTDSGIHPHAKFAKLSYEIPKLWADIRNKLPGNWAFERLFNRRSGRGLRCRGRQLSYDHAYPLPVSSAIAVLKSMLSLTAGATANAATPESTNNVSWSFASGTENFNWLAQGQTLVRTYTLTATGKDNNGKDVAISTEVQGIVDSVDLSASPALLSINGANYTVDKIKRVVRPTTTPTPTPTT